MAEHPPKRIAKPPWRESPYLSFAAKTLHLEGDPEIPEDFTRALSFLEAITDHFCAEFGPWQDKTAWDVAYELSYHNGWHQWEVEQERKAGEKQAAYREISLRNLSALSKRRVLAMAEVGRGGKASLPVAQFVDQLIEQAVADEEAINRLTAPAPNEPSV